LVNRDYTKCSKKKIDDFSTILKPKTTVNVTFLPNTSLLETIEVSKKLFNEGMTPVPHISARAIKNKEELDYFVKSLSENCSVNEVLVISGSSGSPIGDFHETMQILETGILQKYNIQKVGVAGHPEGSPDIKADLIMDSLKRKYEWSLKKNIPIYIETQFLFEAEPVLKWEENIRKQGMKIPVRVGIPGPATIKTLFQFAKSSGIGPSMRMITKQAKNISKLFIVQAPDKYIYDLAYGIHNEKKCTIEHFHFYPFGGFKKTSGWAKCLEEGKFTLNGKGGFKTYES
jgi:methylenetetrahydrofolate reductase (NADPH)